MSKGYALSGLRVGYLCGPERMIAPLRMLNPPWAVGLPGQIAAVAALEDGEYYAGRYQETWELRERLASDQEALGMVEALPGSANFLFLQLADAAPPTQEVLRRCQEQNLFLRDPAMTTPRLGSRTLRIAVKDAATNRRMVEILREALNY